MNATVAPRRFSPRPPLRSRVILRVSCWSRCFLAAGVAVCLWSVGSAGLLAEPTPATSATPAGKPATAVPQESHSPVSGEPNVTSGSRQGPGGPPGTDLVDSLSPGELQKAIETLKANYFRPGEIADGQLQRAMLAGILTRIAPGAALVETGREPVAPSSPFKTETVKESIGYLRLGALNQSNFHQLDAALKSGTSFGALILDLRATPPSNDFQTAADILREFCPSGRPLFSIKKEPATGGTPANSSSNPQQYLSSDQAPSFSGPMMILIAKENAGASEIVAAALRQNAKAILIGEATRGEGVEFADFKLGADKTIRVAVAEVALPDGSVIYPKGLKPDIRVDAPAEQGKILAQELEQGVLPFVTETERPRMNEASLVAGTNPELDALENAQKEKAEKSAPASAPLRDSTLQRALDLIATISIYEKERKP